MPLLTKYLMQSHDNAEITETTARIFHPIEIERLESAGDFECTVAMATIRTMAIFRTSTQSGYTVSYGYPRGIYFEIHFIETGHYIVRTPFQEIEAAPGTAVLLVDNTKVEIDAGPGSSKLTLVLPYSRYAALVRDQHSEPDQHLMGYRSQIVTKTTGLDVLHQMADLLHGGFASVHPFETAPAGAMMFKDALIATFANAWPREGASSAPHEDLPAALKRAVAWLNDHPAEDIPIEQLARLAGASVRTLQNAFRQHLLTSPNAYIQRARLRHVRQELMHGQKSDTIESIASRWGFRHMGYFAARYRAVYGEPPSATRRKRNGT